MTTQQPAPLSQHYLNAIVLAALEEDAPYGDITTQQLIPPETQVTGILAAREAGVLSGAEVFAAAMRQGENFFLNTPAGRAETQNRPPVEIHWNYQDAQAFDAGAHLAELTGPAAVILGAERVGLNLIQRMSGIATETARHIAAVTGSKARVTDTRKTTPGLRALERYAVRCGGGHNHRANLSETVLIKDNHIASLAQKYGSEAETVEGFSHILAELKTQLPHTTHLEVEVDSLVQIPSVLDAGVVDTIMLDNFSLQDLGTAVELIDGRAMVEASGNVTVDTIPAIAATGVDIISVGALTHSVRALDIGLDLGPQTPGAA